MAYLFNGATHIINRADAVVQTFPLTIHGRIRLTAVADGLVHCILGLWEAGSDNGFRLQVELNTGTMKARCGSKASGSASNANSTTSITDTNWHSVVGEISAANARQVWLDNGGNGTNATSLTPGTLTKTSIGAHDNGGTLSGNIAHELADIAVWSGTLTNEERAALASGVSPALIRPDILEIYVPLIRELNDQRGGTFSLTGATVSDHPRVYMPARAFTFKPSVASGAISGSTTLTFAPSGTLTGSGALVGSSTLAFAPSATLTGAGALIGASSLIFTPLGTLTGSGALAGASSLTFAPSGALTNVSPGAMTGSTSITFTVSGTLTGTSSIWTPIAPASGSWANQLAASGAWTPQAAASGSWTSQ